MLDLVILLLLHRSLTILNYKITKEELYCYEIIIRILMRNPFVRLRIMLAQNSSISKTLRAGSLYNCIFFHIQNFVR